MAAKAGQYVSISKKDKIIECNMAADAIKTSLTDQKSSFPFTAAFLP